MSVISPTALRLSGTFALPGDPGYELATPVERRRPGQAARRRGRRRRRRRRSTSSASPAPTACASPSSAPATAPSPFDGDDVILVHTGRLDELADRPAHRRARIGAGVVWQQVLDAAAPHGLAPLVGSAPGVGVVGFLTGGGIGPLVRTFGLSVRPRARLRRRDRRRRAACASRPTSTPTCSGACAAARARSASSPPSRSSCSSCATIYGGALFFDGADAPAVLHAWRDLVRRPAGAREHVARAAAAARPLPGVPAAAGRAPDRRRALRLDGDARAPSAARAAARRGADPAHRRGRRDALRRDRRDPRRPGRPDAGARGPPRCCASSPARPSTRCWPSPARAPARRRSIVELRLLGGALRRERAHPSAFCHRDAAFSLLMIGVPMPIPRVAPHNAAAHGRAPARGLTGGEAAELRRRHGRRAQRPASTTRTPAPGWPRSPSATTRRACSTWARWSASPRSGRGSARRAAARRAASDRPAATARPAGRWRGRARASRAAARATAAPSIAPTGRRRAPAAPARCATVSSSGTISSSSSQATGVETCAPVRARTDHAPKTVLWGAFWL